MSVENKVLAKLKEVWPDAQMEVLNESHMHNVPANSETHFKVTVVSDDFKGVMKVRRHQQVYSLLAEELAGPIHALALHLFTMAEFAALQQSPDSPQCLGGGR